MKNQNELKTIVGGDCRKTIGNLRKQYADLLRLREKVRLIENAMKGDVPGNDKQQRSVRG
jgi:hypothetical protein